MKSDNEGMSKKASDFYGDLEKLAHQDAQEKKAAKVIKNEDYQRRMNKRPFPIAKIILVIGLFSYLFYLNLDQILTSHFFNNHIRSIALVDQLIKKYKLDPRFKMTGVSNGAPTGHQGGAGGSRQADSMGQGQYTGQAEATDQEDSTDQYNAASESGEYHSASDQQAGAYPAGQNSGMGQQHDPQSSVDAYGARRAASENQKVQNKMPEWVVIRGKYYRYRPDNIYYINGERVYFVPKAINK